MNILLFSNKLIVDCIGPEWCQSCMTTYALYKQETCRWMERVFNYAKLLNFWIFQSNHIGCKLDEEMWWSHEWSNNREQGDENSLLKVWVHWRGNWRIKGLDRYEGWRIQVYNVLWKLVNNVSWSRYVFLLFLTKLVNSICPLS